MTLALGAALVALFAITLYAVFGGADFGGGVWDLLATGPRKQAQRDAITHAIGPVWEANHVWVIFAIVVLFTCFPPAFSDIATGLNAPLSFALVGIVMRGAAFVFRNHTDEAPRFAHFWTVIFGVASLLAPFWFGDAVGALATGDYAWTSPFAFAVGVFAVVVCAQMAAVFLAKEVYEDDELRRDFRRRAVRATFAVWVAGAISGLIARQSEPRLFAALLTPTAFIAIGVAMALGLGVAYALHAHRNGWARTLVGLEALAILVGWFGAQAPALVPGRYTLANAASSDAMLEAFLIASAIGALFLIPSLIFLLTVFKGPNVKPISSSH